MLTYGLLVLCPPFQVGSYAERPLSSPGDNPHPGFGVIPEPFPGIGQLRAHGGVDCVEHFWPVQRDPNDVLLLLVLYELPPAWRQTYVRIPCPAVAERQRLNRLRSRGTVSQRTVRPDLIILNL